MQAVLGRAKGIFDGFTAGQRTVTAIAVVVAIVGGVVFLNWASRPSMAPLFTGLASADASTITTKLGESGTVYELTDSGHTVMVPRAEVDQARIDLAGQGLPAGTNEGEGYGLVDKMSLTSSDFQQKLTAKRAYEGELKKAIEKIDTVQDATVQLALPEQDVFTSEQTKPSASVLVKPRATKALSSGNVEAIVHLVSSAVPKLEASQVTVTDSSGKLLNATGAAGAGSGADARVAQAQGVSTTISKKLQAMLDTAVGPGNATVSVQADLDFDDTKVKRNSYLQGKPTDKALQHEKTREVMEGVGGQAVGGVLGPDSISVPNAAGANAKNKYEKTSEKSNNAIGNEQTETTRAPGAIRKMGIAVIINSRTAAGANVAQITKLVTAAAGADAARGDVVEVSKMAFDTQAAENATKEAEAAAAEGRKSELVGLAKNVGLGLLLLIALLIGFRKSRRSSPAVDLGALASASTQQALSAGPTGPPPLEYQLDDDAALRAIEATPVDPQSEARIVARAEIGQLVAENPDEVARLLRGWIAERA